VRAAVPIKRYIASFLSTIGAVNRKLERASIYNSVILAYHRVTPGSEGGKGLQAGMYVEPEVFREHLRFLKSFFSIVSISELSGDLNKGFDISQSKPICVLTFDDGWRDFYTYAFPVLKDEMVPAVVFLPTNFIGSEDWFWTDCLGHLLSRYDGSEPVSSRRQSSGNPLVKRIEGLKGCFESRLEKAIEILKERSDTEIFDVLSELSHKWKLSRKPSGRAFLSWDEVRELGQTGLITFGSHTASHRILTSLTAHEIRAELTESKKRLISENAVAPSFIPFCFPNGNYNEKIASIVKETGYSLAVTTNKGWNRVDSDPFTLCRIGIHQDMTSTRAMFACRILGIL